MRITFRRATLLVLFAGGLLCLHLMAVAPKVAVQFSPGAAGPRQLEETTGKAVARDYAAAWENLAAALSDNRADLLNVSFVGFARNEFRQAIADQQQSGVRTRYVDRGHRLEAVFYSPEGASMQLRDTAQLEMQVLDGDKLLYSQAVTAHYVVIMTPAADRWQVRLLQQVPNP